jgi:hypothetical protein
MRRFIFTSACLFLSMSFALKAQVYKNSTNSEAIHSLTIYPNGDWSSLPIINLGSNNHIEISFDELSHNYQRYAYRIIHCNSDWTRSDINELEYMDGFMENNIEDYEKSVSTFTLYTHYKFSIPNETVKLKLSGNYAVEVFDRDKTDEVLLTACFMLLEDKMTIDANVTATTDIDYEQTHQQLSFDLKPVGLTISQPLSDLHVIVQQNHRRDNEARDITPTQVGSDILRYEHNKALIFEGENEYRRFEITSTKYTSIGVNRLYYFKPFYNAELMVSETRLKGYTSDNEQNGRFYIHSSDAENDTIGSDYMLVHFSFPMESPYIDGGIYLNGDFVDNRQDANSKMIYSFERKAYEKTLLLKQGAYNYQYLFRPTKGGQASPLRLEGSYWETENEYQIFVYYRPIGERYDRLIGFKQIQTAL